MKNIILTVAAVFAFGFANAQEKGTSPTPIKLGVKGGVQLTNLAGDLDTHTKTGFYVGGLADFTIAEKFHVQAEVLYSAEGADHDDFDAGISYFRIPVIGKYYITEGLNVQAGPEFAVKAGTQDDLFEEIITSFDFGFGFGAGYELANGLLFDARYNLGLSNISNVDALDISNTGFQLGLGYRF